MSKLLAPRLSSANEWLAHKLATETGNPLLNQHEVAELLRVSIPTLRRWRANGNGPLATKIGGRVRYRLSEVNQFIVDRTNAAFSEAGHE